MINDLIIAAAFIGLVCGAIAGGAMTLLGLAWIARAVTAKLDTEE